MGWGWGVTVSNLHQAEVGQSKCRDHVSSDWLLLFFQIEVSPLLIPPSWSLLEGEDRRHVFIYSQ